MNSSIYRLAQALVIALLGAPIRVHAEGAGGANSSSAAGAESQATVVVTGGRLADMEERRYSTATKIVYGREELDRHGDTSLADVIKRLPGVTISGRPGRGGEIRMRGLGSGYTQILLDGEPVPRGFSMDSLTPEQIERIEIMRAPVAEHSSRAIAGTINIVLRADFTRRENEVRPGFTWEKERLQSALALRKADRTESMNYHLAANVFHRDGLTQDRVVTSAVNTSTGTPVLARVQADDSRSITDSLHFTSSFNWKPTGGDTFSLQPFVMSSRGTTQGAAQLSQSLGATPAPWVTAQWNTDTDNTVARAMGSWKMRLNRGDRLDMRVTVGLAESNSETRKTQSDGTGAVVHTSSTGAGIRDTTLSGAGKYSTKLNRDNTLVFGLELEQKYRNETSSNIQDGTEPLALYGNSLQARIGRVAAYAQDEIDLTPLWSVYAGLRAETIHTRSSWTGSSATNASSVLSPILHGVWRFAEESRDQIRLSLARTYLAPTLMQIAPRPSLSTNYPAAEANTPTDADKSGNPWLNPQLAWGLDLAFEHYFPAGGIVSLNVFQRNIQNLIRNVTSLQTVSWSPVQRWVSTPRNIGGAVARGIELDAKLRVSELLANAPPLDVRFNFSRFVSHVDGVFGPNNRLDQQPGATANLGLDYRFAKLPLTVGGTLNWTPAYSVQQTNTQFYFQGLKRVFDVYGLWRIDQNMQLRLSASNLLHANYDKGTGYLVGMTEQTAETVSRTYLSWSARLEVKF